MYGYKDISSNFPLGLDFDIKESVRSTIYGSKTESPKGRWIVLQKLKRDERGEPIQSPHTYKLSNEGKEDLAGTATTRTGYLCDEMWIRALLVPSGRLALEELQSPAGNLDTNRLVFITCENIIQHDIFIIPKTDEDGKIISPVTQQKAYIATVPYEKRLDDGRLEFVMTVAEIQK